MLLSIHVKNMALIQEIEIDLGQGLNILTGETGAGKSIIIGAVNVALGSQSFKGFAREDAKYALAELVFSVENERQRERLKELEIPIEDNQVIISRKLVNGRSVSKVNGETVPVSVIREIAGVLIDIHGQHEHQSLLYKKNHLVILDEFAKEELAPYKAQNIVLYKAFQERKQQLEEARLDQETRTKEVDFLQFEIQEIEAAKLIDGEDLRLESRFRKLSHGKHIMEAVAAAYGYTGYETSGAGELTGRALKEIAGVVTYDEALEGLSVQLADIDNLLNDFNRELSDYLSEAVFEESEFDEIEKRLDLINRLKAKYGNSIAAIMAYLEAKKDRLAILNDYEAYRKRLEHEFQASEKKLFENAGQLSRIRKQYSLSLQEQIKKSLIDLNFLEVAFEIMFEKTQTVHPSGFDEVCFMISTNPGEAVKPLNEVASGGELSRIMLAIKSVLANKEATETLIFDEIDVGISGRTAQRVSEKLAVISRNHQVICITHLAQIAAMADDHYVIEKNIEKQMTLTSIRKLNETESVWELARILGGAKITEAVIENAREMKELAVCTKKY